MAAAAQARPRAAPLRRRLGHVDQLSAQADTAEGAGLAGVTPLSALAPRGSAKGVVSATAKREYLMCMLNSLPIKRKGAQGARLRGASAIWWKQIYLTVSAPALQVTPSCAPVPPLQPIAPMSLPPSTSGKPPSDGTTPARKEI